MLVVQAEDGIQDTHELLEFRRVLFRSDDGQWITAAQVGEQAVAASSPAANGRVVVVAGSGSQAVPAVPPALSVAALRNLVDNALRYSPPGSAVDLVADADATTVRFRLTDRGAGLEPDEYRQATQRFCRGRSTGGARGSGLRSEEHTSELQSLMRIPDAV